MSGDSSGVQRDLGVQVCSSLKATTRRQSGYGMLAFIGWGVEYKGQLLMALS